MGNDIYMYILVVNNIKSTKLQQDAYEYPNIIYLLSSIINNISVGLGTLVMYIYTQYDISFILNSITYI